MGRKCCVCRTRPSTRLCDGAIGTKDATIDGVITCDAPMCEPCVFSEGQREWMTHMECDFCPQHVGWPDYDQCDAPKPDWRTCMDASAAAAVRDQVHKDCFSLQACHRAQQVDGPITSETTCQG